MSLQKLTIEDLKTIPKKPLEAELSLQLLVDFYDDCLIGQVFEFHLDHPKQPTVKILFEKDNLCHLLGFQHIFEGEPNKNDYVGYSGHALLKTGEVTFDTFKRSEQIKQRYQRDRERILYFPFLYQVLLNPDFISFSNENLNTQISTEFILYNHKNNRYIHLGVDKHENTEDVYFPRTFFVRKKNDYVVNQEPIEITHLTQYPLSDTSISEIASTTEE